MKFIKNLKTVSCFSLISLIVFLLFSGPAAGSKFQVNPQAKSSLKLFQLQIYVTDIDKAIEFYGTHFGFEVISRDYLPETLPMRFGNFRIVFHKVTKKTKIDYPKDAQTFLVIKVDDLSTKMADLKNKGVELIHSEPQNAAVGIYAAFRDPFGNVHELLEEPSENPAASKPELYAVQVNVENMDKSVEFYCSTLGLEIITRDFYPRVLPLRLGEMMIVLHKAVNIINIDYPNTAQMLINFQVANVAEYINTLKNKKFEVIYDPAIDFPLGLYSAIKDPSGNIHALVEVRQ
ncbi:VOC family protein [candidate division KSB1 bacterium]